MRRRSQWKIHEHQADQSPIAPLDILSLLRRSIMMSGSVYIFAQIIDMLVVLLLCDGLRGHCRGAVEGASEMCNLERCVRG